MLKLTDLLWDIFMKKLLLIFIGLVSLAANTFAEPISVVAAESIYGELAEEIGGKYVNVNRIIDNPNSDPRIFTDSAEINQAVAKAQIVIYNGDGYDEWIQPALQMQTNKNLIIINVAALMQTKPGANPHIWYKTTTMSTLAKKLATQLIALNPPAKADINTNLALFLQRQELVTKKIAQMKQIYSGINVIATEPIFNYMADELGLKMHGIEVQDDVMDESDPSPLTLTTYETLLTSKKVKVLFYNREVTSATTDQILILARQSNVLVVGIHEIFPKNTTISQWFLNELSRTENALKLATAK